MLCCFIFNQYCIGQDETTPKSVNPILVTFTIPRPGTKLESRKIGSEILTRTQKMIGSQYPSSFSTLYKVVPSYIVKDIRTVETMEVRKYVDLEVYLRLRGQGFHKDSLLRFYTATASDVTEEVAAQKALNSIYAEGGKIYSYLAMIDSLFNDRYHIQGKKTLQAFSALPLTTVKECDNVLLELVYFGDYPDMTEAVQAFKNKVLAQRSEIMCKTELPKIRISVESAVYTPEDVVRKLHAVAPDASCSDEVLAIAKLMGEQAMKLAAADSEKLNLIVTFHQENNLQGWRKSQ